MRRGRAGQRRGRAGQRRGRAADQGQQPLPEGPGGEGGPEEGGQGNEGRIPQVSGFRAIFSAGLRLTMSLAF